MSEQVKILWLLECVEGKMGRLFTFYAKDSQEAEYIAVESGPGGVGSVSLDRRPDPLQRTIQGKAHPTSPENVTLAQEGSLSASDPSGEPTLVRSPEQMVLKVDPLILLWLGNVS